MQIHTQCDLSSLKMICSAQIASELNMLEKQVQSACPILSAYSGFLRLIGTIFPYGAHNTDFILLL